MRTNPFLASRQKLCECFTVNCALEVCKPYPDYLLVSGAVIHYAYDDTHRSLEDILVVRALIHVLEPAPTAHVIDEQGSKIRSFCFDIRHELVQAFAAGNVESTPSVIRVRLHDVHVVFGGVLPDHVELVLG